jgi:succinate dehydrogenase / fumarate reductase, membrane anchor subunit
MSFVTKVGRARPQASGWELAIWYLMRLTGLALFVLALTHFLILHLLFDPSQQDSSWIARVRWSSLFWRVFDWTLLMMVLFHAFLGVRTVVGDYTKGGTRLVLQTALYLIAIALFTAGTAVVLTLPKIVPGG